MKIVYMFLTKFLKFQVFCLKASFVPQMKMFSLVIYIMSLNIFNKIPKKLIKFHIHLSNIQAFYVHFMYLIVKTHAFDKSEISLKGIMWLIFVIFLSRYFLQGVH
jgi:hypothetical protein